LLPVIGFLPVTIHTLDMILPRYKPVQKNLSRDLYQNGYPKATYFGYF